MGQPALDAPGRLVQIHQGIGTIVQLVAAAALALARLGGQQRPGAALLLIEVQGGDAGLCHLLGQGLVALLIGEEAVEQDQGIGGRQLFARDEVGGPGRAGPLCQQQPEAPLLQFGVAELADAGGKLLAKIVDGLLLLLGGGVQLRLLRRGEQQQGVEAESPQIPGQLPQLAASLPVGQQDREPR